MIGWLRRLLGGGAGVSRLSPLEAQNKAKEGAIILDVRTLAERKEVKIAGSQSIPLDQLPQQWEKLPKGREIICQCRSGGRSAQAAQFLSDKGFKVYNLAGGLNAWQQAGLPTK
ncbi:MAG: rhodanese-like domain-containing protein [Meiothermus sp.]|nr:rhodanese-like domain-containing protein [Meiothermus sp.]